MKILVLYKIYDGGAPALRVPPAVTRLAVYRRLKYGVGGRGRPKCYAEIGNKNNFELKFLKTLAFKFPRYIFLLNFKLSSFILSWSHLCL